MALSIRRGFCVARVTGIHVFNAQIIFYRLLYLLFHNAFPGYASVFARAGYFSALFFTMPSGQDITINR